MRKQAWSFRFPRTDLLALGPIWQNVWMAELDIPCIYLRRSTKTWHQNIWCLLLPLWHKVWLPLYDPHRKPPSVLRGVPFPGLAATILTGGPFFCLGWIRTPIFQLLVSPLVLTLPLSSQSLHTLHSWFDPYSSCGGHLDFLGSNGGTRESSNRKIHRWYWFLGQNHLWKPFQHVSGLVLRLHFWHGGLAPFPRVCNLIIQPFWGHGAVIDVIASPSSLGFQANEILL